nr:IS66 family insertion sequence element accessory protein TnpB [Janthinobacterium sp. NKUCC06_STL]
MMQLQAASIWLATQPVDMRTGIDGLSRHVQTVPPTSSATAAAHA